MPVIDKVLSRFGLGRKNGEVPIINDGAGNLPSVRVVQGFGLGTAVWTEQRYDRMAVSGYTLNSDVYACVSLIAGAGKQVKWYDGGARSKALCERECGRDGDVREVLCKMIGQYADVWESGDRREKFLKANSNPLESLKLLRRAGGAEFIEQWISYLLLSGNNYLEIARMGGEADKTGTPRDIYLLRPDRVSANVTQSAINTDEKTLVESWAVTAYNQRRPAVPVENIVHSKLFNPTSDVYGMAPLAAAMLRVDAENEGLTLMKRIMQRGFAPGWIEAAKDSVWEDTQVNQLKERIKNSKAAGEELFLENAQWHQMGFAPVDSGITDQQILSKRDIAAVFHVPSQLIGDTAAQTYSNYQEARRALYMEAVIPILVQFKDDWNETIGRDLKSPLEFDRDSFDALTATRAEAAERVTKLFTAGLITQAEARADLEYEPAKPDDVFYAPANIMPLGASATEPQP